MGNFARAEFSPRDGRRMVRRMKLELSPSGRAACRGCKNPVPKGELRFAESYVLPGSDQPGHRYWHLECAAKKLAGPVAQALAAYEGEVPNRAAV